MKAASKKYNCHISLIKNCCDKRGYYQTKNLTFRYFKDNFDYIPHENYSKFKSYGIAIYDINGNIKQTFSSLRDVANKLNVGRQFVSKCCKLNLNGGNNMHNGVIYKFIENPFL